MKLIFAIIQNDDSKKLIRALNKERISVTKIASTGGFLSGGNTTLMIGVENEKVDLTLEVIKRESSKRKETVVVPSTAMPGYADTTPVPMQVTLGGATVFVIDVENNYKF